MNAVKFDFSPYRLSGAVYGTLLNHRPALEALGDNANAAPYKAPPKSPVLYVKPRNTLASNHSKVLIPTGVNELEIGAALGIVIGKTSCRLTQANAVEHIEGFTIVNDVSIPHSVFYRPSVRLKARDGFCPIGPVVAPAKTLATPDALNIRVRIDGVEVHQTSTSNMIRPIAQLLTDVTEFMTLQPGDVLMLGVSHGAPHARAGQRSEIHIEGIGVLENSYVAEISTDAYTKEAT